MFTGLRSLLLLAALTTSTVTPATIKDCGAGKSLFSIKSLALSPVNPNPGEDVALTMDYVVPDGMTVTGGTTTYQVTLNYIPFSPSTNPLCQDIPCPLGAGEYVNTSKSAWPSGVSGSFTSKMIWANDAGQQLACVQISGNLGGANSTRCTLFPPPLLALAAPVRLAAIAAPPAPLPSQLPAERPAEEPIVHRLRGAVQTREWSLDM